MKSPIINASGDAEADVVIVGSGIVGGLMADALVSQGYSVLVLEAGPRIERA
ncbi:NAD(P)-binding protein, partial [Serratia marcescens]